MYGAPSGDLYVQIAVKEHPVFEREGNNLISSVPIHFTTATLGGEINIPTLKGEVKLKIPPETQSGKLFRLRSKGVKSLRSKAVGDLLCQVVVETPVNLSEKQKELLKEFELSLAKDHKKHSPKSKSWFDSVKKFFKS